MVYTLGKFGERELRPHYYCDNMHTHTHARALDLDFPQAPEAIYCLRLYHTNRPTPVYLCVWGNATSHFTYPG